MTPRTSFCTARCTRLRESACCSAYALPYSQIGLTLDDMGSEINVVRLLLGSPPRIALGPIGTSATAYRDVLRATAEFIRSVYDSRWIRGHKRNAKA